MKRTHQLLILAAAILLPSTAGAQQLKDGYIQQFEVTDEQLPTLVTNWKANGKITDDDNFYISRIKPKKRFINRATQANTGITDANDKNVFCWIPFNNPNYNALPDGIFDSEVFSMWPYVTAWGDWSAPLGRIPAALLDVAHKNGVPVSSVIGVPYGNLMATDYIKVRNIASINVSDAADFFEYYGYDGIGYNSEYSEGWGVTAKLRAMHVNLMKEMRNRGHNDFGIAWYDGTNDSGRIQFDYGLDSHNENNFGNSENVASNLFFFNYNWYGTLLANSVDKAKELGRSSFDLYAGMNMQGGEGTKWSDLEQYPISIGLWGAHERNMFWESRNEKGSDPDVMQRSYMLRTERWFSNGKRNPAVFMATKSGSHPYNVDNFDWHGISKFVSARSSYCWSLDEEPMITYFNLGNGKFFNWKGERQNNCSWYNVGVQDYLPTWRWWFANGVLSGDVPESGLDAEFIWNDAYVGGSCFHVFGNTTDEYLHLFKTEYTMKAGDVITIRYKLAAGSTDASLVLTAKGTETEDVNKGGLKFIESSLVADDEEWVEKKFTVGNELNGKALALVALHFQNAKNLDLRLGEFSIVRGSTPTPAAPQIVSSKMLANSKLGMDAKLIWKMANNKAANKPVYNTDVNTSLFKIYAQQEGGKQQLIGITTSWAAIYYSIPVDFTLSSQKMRLGVSALSLDQKTESSITWTEYLEPTQYVYNDDIQVNKLTIKPNEDFTVSYVDPRHPEATWTIEDKDGNVVASGTGTSYTCEGLANTGLYTLKVNGTVYADGTTASTEERVFTGYIPITSETIGALPEVRSITVNGDTKEVNVKTGDQVDVAYTGRSANGKLSRGINMKEYGMGFKASEAGMTKSNTPYTLAFWVKFNSLPTSILQFIDWRDQFTNWPQNNWGNIWSTWDPATKELQVTIRKNQADGGTEHSSFWELNLTPGVWTHIALAMESNGTGIRPIMYVNGAQLPFKRYTNGSSTGEGQNPSFQETTSWWDNAQFVIGIGRHQCAAWDAVIDDVKFFTSTKTADEMRSIMNDNTITPDGFWDFETNADDSYNFASKGSNTAINMARVSIVKAENEGQGTLTKMEPIYEAGSPFVAGDAFSVTTEPTWKARKATLTDATGNDKAGSAKVSYSKGGDYTVSVTLTNSYGSSTLTTPVIHVTSNTAINGVDASKLKVYTIDRDILVELAEAGNYLVQVYNMSGAQVAGKSVKAVAGEKAQVSVNQKGVYLLKVVKDGKTLRAVKLICK